MEQENRCSRSPSTTEGVSDVLQVVPACLGTGQQQLQPQCIPLLTGHQSCCLYLLTLPPHPSSSALSFSVIKRIEAEMSSQILSLQLFPFSVLQAPAQNSSTSLCSWLQQAQPQPLHLTCPQHSHNSQPASYTTHRENNLQILLETPLPRKKKRSWI